MATTTTADPVVMTDGNGRAALPHELGRVPDWVRLEPGDANRLPLAVVLLDVDAEAVGFRVFRAVDGQPLRHDAVTVRMNVS